MTKDQIKCTVLSCNSRDSFRTNTDQLFELASQSIHAQPTDWLAVPEVFDFVGAPSDIKGPPASKHDELVERCSRFAKTNHLVFFAGSIHEPHPDPKEMRCFNTSYVFGRDGTIQAKYRKIHLFELYDSKGNKTHSEADNFVAGQEFVHLKVDGLSVGLLICYDLRFTAMFEKIFLQAKPDVLMVPAAFTKSTGMAHWEVLLRARAIEYQCYVVAANQTGQHGLGKESFGHAMIIDPWGEKLCDTGESVGFAQAILQPGKITEVRTRLPSLRNRRADIY
jgi:predicted amidohydrolase